jgi:hypothetical protein
VINLDPPWLEAPQLSPSASSDNINAHAFAPTDDDDLSNINVASLLPIEAAFSVYDVNVLTTLVRRCLPQQDFGPFFRMKARPPRYRPMNDKQPCITSNGNLVLNRVRLLITIRQPQPFHSVLLPPSAPTVEDVCQSQVAFKTEIAPEGRTKTRTAH